MTHTRKKHSVAAEEAAATGGVEQSVKSGAKNIKSILRDVAKTIENTIKKLNHLNSALAKEAKATKGVKVESSKSETKEKSHRPAGPGK